MSTDYPRIAVVGATGAVGREALAILAERGCPADRILALASARSAGRKLAFGETEVEVAELTDASLHAAEVAIFAASSDIARAFAPNAADAGVICVDNSSAFRMDPAVPLVVPEINADALAGGPRLVANPNCSTIILLVGLEPIRKAFGIEHVVVSTYQAVSGAGIAAMEELEQQARAFAEGRPIEPGVFPQQCLFNVFIHESAIDPETGMNTEETKMLNETRRIWRLDRDPPIVPTCVRVPVLRAHSESVAVRLSRPATIDELREAVAAGDGVELIDDPASGRFPTPLMASNRDAVLAGRIKRAPTATLAPGGRADQFTLFLCGDQIRKGAALNAIQIADRLHPGMNQG